MNTKLKRIKDTLLTVTSEVYHYFADTKAKQYIVWTEEMEADALHADDKKIAVAIQGSIDLFTKVEFDPIVEKVEKALDYASISYTLESITFEEETKFIHYEWIWEIS